MKIVMATNNSGKALELGAILSKAGFEVLTLKEAGFHVEVEEDGKTFMENAIKKAVATYKETKMPAIGDDSGLSAEALCGAPGIYSARWAGEGATQDMLISKLWKELEGKINRRASFHSAIALAFSETDIITAEGTVDGEIIFEKRGEGGFGYDPVFLVSSLGKTYAELSASEKNEISHRAVAMKNLYEKLCLRIK